MAALLVQSGLYFTLVHRVMRANAGAGVVQAALKRWLIVAAGWQLAVLVASGAYVAVEASQHAAGAAWIAPPLAAVIGTALPLQVAVVGILRAGRR